MKRKELKKIMSGLYEKTVNGKVYIIEYVTKKEGFSRNEWHMGEENDPHANQFESLKDCLMALESINI